MAAAGATSHSKPVLRSAGQRMRRPHRAHRRAAARRRSGRWCMYGRTAVPGSGCGRSSERWPCGADGACGGSAATALTGVRPGERCRMPASQAAASAHPIRVRTRGWRRRSLGGAGAARAAGRLYRARAPVTPENGAGRCRSERRQAAGAPGRARRAGRERPSLGTADRLPQQAERLLDRGRHVRRLARHWTDAPTMSDLRVDLPGAREGVRPTWHSSPWRRARAEGPSATGTHCRRPAYRRPVHRPCACPHRAGGRAEVRLVPRRRRAAGRAAPVRGRFMPAVRGHPTG
ncbi:hypothetical protein CLV72_101760 [Allonocardiopsis opalescens]|uniref:Uncharacterized protein n=1 Tax=Allonocardiopsis opalescens TaxID=1144618 RepID=A0A2T0QE09_9ACTN|nr:hypothetical protein CLV72_101760 [Allonocardiopsis opalescens]